jgi:DNA-binding MarR family transcriptional regulator
MEKAETWSQRVVLPALLGAARSVYGEVIRAALADAGYDDMPKRGSFILGAIANHGSTLASAVKGLRTSKQAASQLVDALVLRGYLERTPDEQDRRRVKVALTERGRDAARVVRQAVQRIDTRLTEQVGAQAIITTRTVLGALIESGNDPHFASRPEPSS